MRLRSALAAWLAAAALAACATLAPPTPTERSVVATPPVVTPAATAPVQTAPAAQPTSAAPITSAPPPAVETPPGAAGSPTQLATPTPGALQAELARALANPPPKRDVVDLARRFRIKPGTPTPLASPTAAAPQVGDVHDFWVADSARRRYFRARARLLVRSDHADFYVQDGEQVSADAARQSLDTFEQKIVPTVIQDFGADRLSADNLHVTILNVRLGGLVGYYSSVDEYPSWAEPYSNERPLIGMSLSAVQPGTRGYDSGLAHEFEHFVQWRLDPGENTWVNEGTAELAIRAVGLDPSGNYNSFLSQPDVQLNDWAEQVSQTIPHYGASDLFFTYLSSRFGGYRVVGDILARPERGEAGVDAVLSKLAKADQPASFDAAFLDWSIANWANQAAPTDPRYGYRDLPNVRARDEPIVVPTAVSASVHQYAAHYYALPADAAGATLTVTSPPTTVLVPAGPRPAPFWWSNRADSGDSRLTRTVDLSAVAKATLRFSTWYDLERDFDYAYVAVSADGGITWTTLPGRYTADADPNGANLGVGYTGKSGGSPPAQWLDDEVDLSAYAGRKILLRFEVVTDDAYDGPGFCVDGARIDEIGWRDRPDATDWQAEGFVRIANRVPESFAARVVGLFGHDVRLYPVPIAADGSGTLRLPDELRRADHAALVVASHTPLTPATIDFAVRFDRGP